MPVTRTQASTPSPSPPPAPLSFAIASISLSSPMTKSKSRQGMAVVVVTDAKGKRVIGTTVSGLFRYQGGRAAEKANGLTASKGPGAGSVTLRTKAAWSTYDSTLQFCVTMVTKARYAYYARGNKVTCVNIKAA